MTQDEGWQRRLVEVIAGQVRRIRQERGMSAQRLADRCEALGVSVPRVVIANLESGRRESVSVAELIVLARALDVPPLLLLYPIGSAPTVDVLPSVERPTWPAAKWFTGDDPFPDGEDPRVELQAWMAGALPLRAFRKRDELAAEVRAALRDADSAQIDAETAATSEEAEQHRRLFDAHHRNAQTLGRMLREHEQAMREQGLLSQTEGGE